MTDPAGDIEDPATDRPRSTLDMVRARPLAAVAIFAVLGAFVLLLVYVGGWLSPKRLTIDRFTDELEANAGGAHHGFRREHAKGLCVAGHFTGSADASHWSRAAVFNGRIVPVIGRFAESDPDPYEPDGKQGVRSMALRMQPAGAPEWRTGMNDMPGFPVSTPQDFYALMVASAPVKATGSPDPERMHAFVAAHPEFAAFQARMSKRLMASGFSNDTFNSLNGFVFVAPDGSRRLVRWSMVAEASFATLRPNEQARKPGNYAFDELARTLSVAPARWHLVATFANPGDPNRAADVWPIVGHKQVDMGELVLTHAESEAPGNCRDLNFDPLILPPGITPSDDPLPYARSAIYSGSFRRREGEPKPPSAVANIFAGKSQ
jgi:catalase